MARRQKKQKNYVFPEYERSRLGIALGIDAFQVLFFGPLYMVILFDYKTSAHQKTMLLAWGIITAVFMIVPLLYGLKDYPRRSARYAFGGGFCQYPARENKAQSQHRGRCSYCPQDPAFR